MELDMIQKYLKLVTASTLLLSSLCAQAGLITDVETINTKLNFLQSKSWTHNINDDGFTFGSAVSGKLSIELSDDAEGDGRFGFPELATIVVGIIDFQDGAWIYNPVNNFNQNLGFNSLGGLNSSGLLDVKVWSTLGDFYIGKSTLEVTTRDEDPRQVPEPSTLSLLGVGLISLLISRRKKML
jgi:hypothetical protein